MKEMDKAPGQPEKKPAPPVPSAPPAPPAPPAPKSGVGEALSGAKENVDDSKESLGKAKDSLKGLLDPNSKVNIVDAAMAVKGAFDSVKGLTGKISESLAMPLLKALGAFKGQATMPAGKQMDPVLGIDVHMVTIPPSPAPVPLPHPYIGILFNAKDWVSCAINTFKKDALDLLPPPAEDDKGIVASVATNKEAIAGIAMGLAGMSASVKFGDFIPRAITGTKTKSIPHIPFGAGWFPANHAAVAKDNGKAFLGSLFVVADGDPMVGSFHLNYDCWDVGVIDIFKGRRASAKKAPEPGQPKAELFVPSGTVMPIPIGRPVLVNSIPTPINPLAILDKLFKAGLGKLKKAGRALAQKGLDKLNGKVGCGPLTAASKLIGTGQSHPVDVAGGHFYTDNIDFKLPGPIPISFERTWYSYSSYNGPLGHGWHHSYDMALSLDNDTQIAILRMADGRVAHFELPAVDKETYNRAEKLTLHLHKDGYYYISDAKSLLYRFTQQLFRNPFNGTETFLLQSIANRNGFAIRFNYDSNALLIKIIDSAGRVLIVNNNDQGCITSIEAPDPRFQGRTTFHITSYAYTSERDMANQADALDQSIKYEYQNHLMVKETWRNGCTWHFKYNKPAGIDAKCTEVWGTGGLLHYKFDYTDQQCTVVINSLGGKKKFYHNNGLVTRYVDPLGAEWEYRYNQYNEKEWEIDPLGNERSYSHDQWGNKSLVTEPNGAFSKVVYGSGILKHSRVEAVDKSGGKWKWEYDILGNLISRLNPLNAEIKYEYADGLLSVITNAEGVQTTLTYDNHYNLIKENFSRDHAQQWTYDDLGNCIKSSDPMGNVRITQFNLLAHPTKIIEPDGNTRFLDYDAEANVIREKDNLYDIRFSYNYLSQVQTRTQGGNTLRYKYDTECSLSQIINEHNEVYTLEKDGAGKVIREIGFDGVTINCLRDAAGKIIRIEKPENKFKQFTYDEVGNITEVKYSDENFERYSYARDGFIVSAENNDSFIRIERGSLGRISKETTNAGVINYQYDIAGNRTGITSSLGAKINNTFGIAGNLITTSANGWSSEVNYNEGGLEIERLLPGGISSEWERDNIGRPIRQLIKSAKTNVYSKQYTWDVNYRLKKTVDSVTGLTQFIHDEVGNLSHTIYGDGSEQLRTPDATGNLFKTADRSDRNYGRGGRLLKANGNTYKYNADGDLVEKKTTTGKIWQYVWDGRGYLRKVVRPDGDTVNFTYDAFGRRLSKTYKNTVTRWLWDGNKPLHEWKEHLKTGAILSDTGVAEGGVITWMFKENTFVPIAKIKGEKNYSIVTDYLGTPYLMYDTKGEKFWESDLDSYGKVRMYKGDKGSCPFRYQGQYEDVETGLYYNRFRYYDSEDGVYLKQDPIGLRGGIRPYGYVNDPNKQVDIFGLVGTGTCSVYHLYDLDENGKPKGDPYYVGITDDGREKTRADEHENSGRLTGDGTTRMVVQQTGLSPETARGVEQAHIDHYDTKTGIRKGTVMPDGSVHDGEISQENRGNKNNSFAENDTREKKRQDEMVAARDAEKAKLEGDGT